MLSSTHWSVRRLTWVARYGLPKLIIIHLSSFFFLVYRSNVLQCYMCNRLDPEKKFVLSLFEVWQTRKLRTISWYREMKDNVGNECLNYGESKQASELRRLRKLERTSSWRELTIRKQTYEMGENNLDLCLGWLRPYEKFQKSVQSRNKTVTCEK